MIKSDSHGSIFFRRNCLSISHFSTIIPNADRGFDNQLRFAKELPLAVVANGPNSLFSLERLSII